MENEKKYNKALERARECMKDGGISQNTIDYLCNIFPELAESEDEKIRKELKRAIAVALDYSYFDKVTADNCLAWLEKQGEQMSRKEIDLMRLYNRVLITFGIENQTFMLVEECAELLNAVAKLKRGRATKEDIITELADVSIMVEQLAFFYGWDEFKEEKERKLTRLEDRINHHTKKGGGNERHD